jgi:hypothetical protein
MWRVWGRGEAYTGLWWGNILGERPLGRPKRRWKGNLKIDLQEIGCGGVDWVELAQDRDRWQALVTAVMNLRVP